MLVKVLVGRRAGETVEISTPEALAMLADGRAQDIRSDPPARTKRRPKDGTHANKRSGRRTG